MKQLAPPEYKMPAEFLIQSWSDLMARAEFLAQSQLIPSTLRGKKNDVAVILQMGWELGIPPMQALNGIDVIQGKPCVSPQLAIALIRSKVPSAVIEYLEITESKAVVRMARDKSQMSEAYTATWDMEKAKKMQLAGKDNYVKQPGNMLKWRSVGEAAKAVFPDVLKGFYLEHEMIDVNPPGDDPNKNKIEDINRVINAEVVPAKQEIAPEIQAASEEGLDQWMQSADYVIPFGEKNKGKRLGDLSASQVEAYMKEVMSSLSRLNREPEEMHLQFFKAAETYLAKAS